MNDKYRDEELTDKYLNGELSREELQDFERLLAQDEDLMVSLEIEKGLRKIYLEKETLVFREEVRAARASMKEGEELLNNGRSGEKSPEQKNTARVIPFYKRGKFLLAAASVLLLAAITIIFLLISGQAEKSSARLFAGYYEPYPADGTARSEAGMESPENVAIQYYASGEYAKASGLLKELSLNYPEDDKFSFYYAITLIETNELPSAIAVLETMAGKNSGFFKEQSRWYLAMALLKQGDDKRTKDVLSLIINQKGYNFKEAENLLKKIRKE